MRTSSASVDPNACMHRLPVPKRQNRGRSNRQDVSPRGTKGVPSTGSTQRYLLQHLTVNPLAPEACDRHGAHGVAFSASAISAPSARNLVIAVCAEAVQLL